MEGRNAGAMNTLLRANSKNNGSDVAGLIVLALAPKHYRRSMNGYKCVQVL
jgi:hypothetical protein